MLTSTPAGIDKIHVLPDDWKERALAHEPPTIIEPLINAIKALIRQHGDAAIAIDHVQELALLACDMAPELRFKPYLHVFDKLTRAAGGNWPITIALDEQKLEQKPVLDAAQRLITCDGEWLALHALVHNGWTPTEPENRNGRDWTVTKAGITLPIEVKTKQATGSDLGRLQFALRGLSLLRQGKVFRRHTSHWSRGTNLTRAAASAYYDLLVKKLSALDQLLTPDFPKYDPITIAANDDATLTVQRYDDDGKFALDFTFIAPGTTDKAREQNQLTLILEPNRHPNYLQIGAVDAHFLREHDEGMREELELVLDRLRIAAQAKKRSTDTVVLVIWEVPWYWTLDLARVGKWWRAWSTTAGVRLGLLLPVGLDRPIVIPTAAVEVLFPTLNIYA